MRRARAWLGALLLFAVVAAIGALPGLRIYWRWRETNPIRSGLAVAERAGCISCHGPHGTKGLPDPKSGEDVPTWDGGMPMMYVSGVEDVREYILDGVSKRRAASPTATAAREKEGIRMPAYRGFLSPSEVEEVIAYFMAASRSERIEDASAARGRDLVVKFRCESCHGVGGSGGLPNPGSLKGYIPGWLGPDFAELAADETELRSWVMDGGIERLGRDPLARFFLARQRLQMPSYRKAVSPEDTDAIVAYIRSLRKKQ